MSTTVSTSITPIVVAAYTDLANTSPGNGQAVMVRTGAAAGVFYFDSASSATVDNINVINGPHSNGRFLRLAVGTGSSDVECAANVAALYALGSAVDNQLYQTLGYTTEGIGANLYRYDAGSSATPDYGFTLDGPGGDGSGTGTGRFIAVDQTVADITKFGAYTAASDNATAIQRAINAVLATHGVVYIPTGTFYIKSTLLIDTSIYAGSDSLTIAGNGPTASMIARGTTFTGSAMLESNTDNINGAASARTIQGCVFRDFRIYCDNSSSRVDYGIWFKGVAHCTFEQVWVSVSEKIGFNIEYSWSNVFTHCRADNNVLHGFVFNHQSTAAACNDTTLIGCISVGNGGCGYYFDGGYVIRLLGCAAENCEQTGLYINKMSGVEITGYYGETNAATGIAFTTYSGGSLVGGSWTVKSEIILNGSAVQMHASTFVPCTDVSFAYQSQGVAITGQAFRGTGVSMIAFLGCEGVNVTGYASQGATADFLFHGAHTLAKRIEIGQHGSDNKQQDAVSIRAITTQYSSRFDNISISDCVWPMLTWSASALTMVLAGDGGTSADSTLAYQGSNLYRLSATPADASSTDFYGKTIDLGEYWWMRGKYMCLLVEWFAGFNHNDVYGGLLNGGLRLIANGYVDTNSIAVDAAGEVETTGSINAASPTLTVASATELKIGDWINVSKAGTGTNKGAHFSKITNIVGTTVTLATNASTTVVGQVVRTSTPRMAYMTVQFPTSGSVTIGAQRFLGRADDAALISSMMLLPFGSKWPYMGE